MKNRTLGSIFIVAGTTIGAGMLAMPLAAAGVGFGMTLLLLGTLWALMCYTALLLRLKFTSTCPPTPVWVRLRRAIWDATASG